MFKDSILEDSINSMDFTQNRGIFLIPDLKDNSIKVRRYLENQDKNDIPLIVEEEKYNCQSLITKLGEGRCDRTKLNLIYELIELGYIRGVFNNGSRVSMIDNLSAAQVLSFFKKFPIERILKPESYFQGYEFQRLPIENQVSQLCNAYKGSYWFERFKKRYNLSRYNQKIVEWHLISLTDLPRLLCTEIYEPTHNPESHLVKLISKGFIRPKDNEFKKHSMTNFVDNYSLACFLSNITGKSVNDVLIKDDYIDEIIKNYIENRLIPFMIMQGLELSGTVTLKFARDFLNTDGDKVLKYVRSVNRSKNSVNPKITLLRALDFSIYFLKDTRQPKFYHADVSRMFGMKNIDMKRIGIRANKHGTFDNATRIFPFYDLVIRRMKKGNYIKKYIER